ncbi:hypothetical protein BN137_1565 [Cronobacter condimenti 1330]|uniref:Uncharacterized protein n=1 Tax=Cronobacter condimenti 1330 TaxID=1073999 RepID=K8A0D8_9ENTR|nr:hypothetical protein BN137_1565 [Cronobacter condimenti 1330]
MSSVHITDVWMWQGASHGVWQTFIEALRDIRFWNDFLR